MADTQKPNKAGLFSHTPGNPDAADIDLLTAGGETKAPSDDCNPYDYCTPMGHGCNPNFCSPSDLCQPQCVPSDQCRPNEGLSVLVTGQEENAVEKEVATRSNTKR